MLLLKFLAVAYPWLYCPMTFVCRPDGVAIRLVIRVRFGPFEHGEFLIVPLHMRKMKLV